MCYLLDKSLIINLIKIMYSENFQNAFCKFMENGGQSREEFWAGRKQALAEAAARSKKHAEAALAAREERIAHLMQRGSRAEAEEQLRLEAYEAHDAMGANPVVRIKRTPIPQVGLHIQAPKK